MLAFRVIYAPGSANSVTNRVLLTEGGDDRFIEAACTVVNIGAFALETKSSFNLFWVNVVNGA